MKQHFINNLYFKGFLLGATISLCFLGISFLFAWTEPLSNPPTGNVASPLNVGDTPQVKSGKLGINTSGIDANYALTLGSGLKITNTGTQPTLYLEDESGDTTPFVIDADGNVGIGTSTPSEKLDVAGNIKTSGQISANELCIGGDCKTSWPTGGPPTYYNLASLGTVSIIDGAWADTNNIVDSDLATYAYTTSHIPSNGCYGTEGKIRLTLPHRFTEGRIYAKAVYSADIYPGDSSAARRPFVCMRINNDSSQTYCAYGAVKQFYCEGTSNSYGPSSATLDKAIESVDIDYIDIWGGVEIYDDCNAFASCTNNNFKIYEIAAWDTSPNYLLSPPP